MTGAPEPPSLDPILWKAERAHPANVALLSGLKSFGVFGGGGDFRWVRETRGARFDWGGAYGQGIRLSGPWTLRFEVDSRSHGMEETLVSLTARRHRVDSIHHTEVGDLLQSALIPPTFTGVARRLEFHSVVDRPLLLSLRSEVEPFLAPLLVEGLRPSEYRFDSLDGFPRLRALGSSLVLASAPRPDAVQIDGIAWSGESASAPRPRVSLEHTLTIPPNGVAATTLLLWGGVDRTLAAETPLLRGELSNPEGWARAAEALWQTWVSGTPELRLPEAPELEAAYSLARSALRALYYEPDPGFRGLRAGVPWYADVWGRDLAWMLPAVLWMNDADWAEGALRTMFRFQAPERLPMLGAELGELPMQVSPGPIFLYGTSDTTLYYPDRVRRLIAHTGGFPGLLQDFAKPLALIDRWIDAKTDSSSGLLRNGGEIEGMRAAVGGAGSVSYGIDAPDTTIWDSTDRRDHAVDLQVLAYEAENALAEISEQSGNPAGATKARARASGLRGHLQTRYRWAGEQYLYDSLRIDGSPVEKLRPNALLAVTAELLSPELGAALIQRAARPDLTTPWGVRTLSNLDPTYDPRAYHDGQVWPIATAWAARATFAARVPELGVEYLRTLARMFLAEGGLANECYRGDAPEPWNSCCLLGFSVGPFLTTLFEGLWGITPDLAHRRVRVDPAFPAGWRSARIDGLRFAEGILALGYEDGRLTVLWSGELPITLRHAGEDRTLPPYRAQVLSRTHT
jgi:hypothetical protein